MHLTANISNRTLNCQYQCSMCSNCSTCMSLITSLSRSYLKQPMSVPEAWKKQLLAATEYYLPTPLEPKLPDRQIDRLLLPLDRVQWVNGKKTGKITSKKRAKLSKCLLALLRSRRVSWRPNREIRTNVTLVFPSKLCLSKLGLQK